MKTSSAQVDIQCEPCESAVMRPKLVSGMLCGVWRRAALYQTQTVLVKDTWVGLEFFFATHQRQRTGMIWSVQTPNQQVSTEYEIHYVLTVWSDKSIRSEISMTIITDEWVHHARDVFGCLLH